MSVSMTPLLHAWMSSNVAGHTKRAFATTVLNAAFALENIIGPQTFQAKDAPAYHSAKMVIFATQCCVAGISVALGLYYTLVNRKRSAYVNNDGEDFADAKAYSGLTAKQNKEFRYIW